MSKFTINFKIQKVFTVLMLLASINTFAQNEFKTKWVYSNTNPTISFNTLTTGNVNYTWTASPSGNTGTGSITGSNSSVSIYTTALANDTIILSLQPTNLRRFYFNEYSYISGLKDVSQWGSTPWSSMNHAFSYCMQLTGFTATDAPDLSNVTDMSYMFINASLFNSNIGNWNTANVNNMSYMFLGASLFNSNIGSWNTSNVTNMGDMFYADYAFNQNISNWNTANVTDMSYMFFMAPAFNQNISNWNTANVNTMLYMFYGATNFNQNLGSWNIGNVNNMTRMLISSGLDCNNYSNTLIGWATNNPTVTNITLDADGLSYNSLGQSARDTLTGTRGWTINGDNYDANCSGSVLPVKLVSFTSQVMDCTINLKWVAASEENFKVYIVEKSTDGKNYTEISQITPTGSGSQYAYKDDAVRNETYYHRLKMLDIDGNTSYSDVINTSISNCSNSLVKIAPNPTRGHVIVALSGYGKVQSNGILYNSLGQAVKSITLGDGNNDINLEGLAAGIYQFIFTDNNTRATISKKIIKQ